MATQGSLTNGDDVIVPEGQSNGVQAVSAVAQPTNVAQPQQPTPSAPSLSLQDIHADAKEEDKGHNGVAQVVSAVAQPTSVAQPQQPAPSAPSLSLQTIHADAKEEGNDVAPAVSAVAQPTSVAQPQQPALSASSLSLQATTLDSKDGSNGHGQPVSTVTINPVIATMRKFKLAAHAQFDCTKILPTCNFGRSCTVWWNSKAKPWIWSTAESAESWGGALWHDVGEGYSVGCPKVEYPLGMF